MSGIAAVAAPRIDESPSFRSRREAASAAIIGTGRALGSGSGGWDVHADAGGTRLACSAPSPRATRPRSSAFMPRRGRNSTASLLRILGKPDTGRRGHAGDLSQGLENGRAVRPDAREPDHLDGGDRAQPRHRHRAQARRNLSIEDEPEAHGGRRRNAGAAGAARDDRGAQAAARPASASSIRRSSASCCSPITAAGAANSSPTKLDIPVNTIKTWLRRSLLEIRECMGQ